MTNNNIEFATPRNDLVAVLRCERFGNEVWLEIDGGWDYDGYRAAPRVLEFNGKLFYRSGFNSDTGRIGYCAGNRPLARTVSKSSKSLAQKVT